MKYLIKNLSGKELEMDWTIDLLPEDIYVEWLEYQKTTDYNNAVRVQQRRIMDILNDFVNDRRLGEMRYRYTNDPNLNSMDNQIKITQFKFVMPKDAIILVSERVMGRFKSLERFPIVQTKNGVETEEVMYEGFIEIEPVNDDYDLEVTDIKDDEDIDLLTGKKYFELRRIAKDRGLKTFAGIKQDALLELLKEDMKK